MKNSQKKYLENENKKERLRKAILFGLCSFLLDSKEEFSNEEIAEVFKDITENFHKALEESRKIR